MEGLRVAVALAVVMILKLQGDIGVVTATGAHRMAWYSTSQLIGTRPESTVTAMKGSPADVQARGQGRLANDVTGGEVKAETPTGGG